MELDIINPNCAGIYIGSKSHFVAVGQALEDVKEFGVYADDLTAICMHLKTYGITSVAMERTNTHPVKKEHTDNKIHKKINKNSLKGIDLNQAATNILMALI